MPETKEEALILVGHYHHVAECECGTVTTVESYYKDLPPIICPSCQMMSENKTELQEDPLVSDCTIKCKKCGCAFMSVPYPPNAKCPACTHPIHEPEASTE